jgi:hypothetical protein
MEGCGQIPGAFDCPDEPFIPPLIRVVGEDKSKEEVRRQKAKVVRA